jgi:hypothetical protein
MGAASVSDAAASLRPAGSRSLAGSSTFKLGGSVPVQPVGNHHWHGMTMAHWQLELGFGPGSFAWDLLRVVRRVHDSLQLELQSLRESPSRYHDAPGPLLMRCADDWDSADSDGDTCTQSPRHRALFARRWAASGSAAIGDGPGTVTVTVTAPEPTLIRAPLPASHTEWQ